MVTTYIVKRGWAFTSHPHQSELIFAIMTECIRQRAAVATLCVLIVSPKAKLSPSMSKYYCQRKNYTAHWINVPFIFFMVVRYVKFTLHFTCLTMRGNAYFSRLVPKFCQLWGDVYRYSISAIQSYLSSYIYDFFFLLGLILTGAASAFTLSISLSHSPPDNHSIPLNDPSAAPTHVSNRVVT
jgi:hypothetical protein